MDREGTCSVSWIYCVRLFLQSKNVITSAQRMIASSKPGVSFGTSSMVMVNWACADALLLSVAVTVMVYCPGVIQE